MHNLTKKTRSRVAALFVIASIGLGHPTSFANPKNFGRSGAGSNSATVSFSAEYMQCSAAKLIYEEQKNMRAKVKLLLGKKVARVYELAGPVPHEVFTASPAELFSVELPVCWPRRNLVLAREYLWATDPEMGRYPWAYDGLYSIELPNLSRRKITDEAVIRLDEDGKLYVNGHEHSFNSIQITPP